MARKRTVVLAQLLDSGLITVTIFKGHLQSNYRDVTVLWDDDYACVVPYDYLSVSGDLVGVDVIHKGVVITSLCIIVAG